MTYESLSKLFYKDSSSDRFERNAVLAEARRQADSSFLLGMKNENGEELFFSMPRELAVLSEAVLRREREISDSLSTLPGIARSALVRNLVISEVVSTNQLEGIHSTRKQINDLLEGADSPSEPFAQKRFRELAKLYMGLSDPRGFSRPEAPEDIRLIYDRVMDGEHLGSDAPDGRLFRKNAVEVIGAGGKVLHEGLMPEEAIVGALSSMLSLANSPDVPELMAAIAAHYIFEYVHPFYDGNGRTGRYLLALHLSHPLSQLTALSLSRAIADSKAAYYRAFKDAENPLNHGEITTFMICMMEYLSSAQVALLEDLELNAGRLREAEIALRKVAEERDLPSKQLDVLFVLVQSNLFAAFPDVSLADLALAVGLTRQGARPHVKELEKLGLVVAMSQKPLRFALAEEARRLLSLS